jgi:predicted nucleic acid-binding protein
VSAVLDTTVLVDVLRDDRRAVGYLLGLERIPVCSEVSRVEVIEGLRSSERAAAERLFQELTWVPVDQQIARHAGEFGRRYRRSHDLGLADLVVAATAQRLGLPLATSNVRDLPMFPRLRPPY